ncbi:MAG: thioredoxin family protein [Cyanobacteria bacterium P01_H01_bin.74]
MKTALNNLIQWVFGAFIVALCLSVPNISLASSIPPLDAKVLAEADGKFIMMDFYSSYCATCQAMDPYLKMLAKKQKKQLLIKHIDIGTPEGKQYITAYGIDGTPTYVLFSKAGEPVYKMSDRISPVVLEKQFLRIARQLRPVFLSDALALPDDHLSGTSPLASLILLAVEKPACSRCDTMRPFLKGFELAQNNGLKVIYVNQTSDAGQQLTKALRIKSVPTYVLLDNGYSSFQNANTRGELLTLKGSIEPKRLWHLIRMFSATGLE